MGYRYNIPTDKNGEPPKPEDMLPRFEIRNGAILKIAFKCRYLLHNHDHPMYVYPHIAGDVALLRRENHRPYDKLSQAKFPIKSEPINLIDEGYEIDAKVAFEDADEYLTATGRIDTEEQNMIRIAVNAQYPEFSDKPIEKRFTVFIRKNRDDGITDSIDAVCHGIIVVLPGKPFNEGE